jgi:hypothetical protein
MGTACFPPIWQSSEMEISTECVILFRYYIDVRRLKELEIFGIHS